MNLPKGSEVLIVSGEIDSLALISQWVDSTAEKWGLPHSSVYAINLCCEEGFSNTVRHGLASSNTDFDQEKVRLELRHEADLVTLIIEDRGLPFNPLQNSPPVVPNNLADAKIGGLGILLMRQFSQKMTYIRQNQSNLLYLNFALPH
jgi:serine/threonine-protein kinase RsbW